MEKNGVVEPDVQFEIKTQIDVIKLGKYEYCAKGCEIEDITVLIVFVNLKVALSKSFLSSNCQILNGLILKCYSFSKLTFLSIIGKSHFYIDFCSWIIYLKKILYIEADYLLVQYLYIFI